MLPSNICLYLSCLSTCSPSDGLTGLLDHLSQCPEGANEKMEFMATAAQVLDGLWFYHRKEKANKGSLDGVMGDKVINNKQFKAL